MASSETLAAVAVPSPFGAGSLRLARGVSPRGGRHHAIGDCRRLRLQADSLAGIASGTSHCRHLPSTVRHVRAGRLRDLACTAHRAAAPGGAGNPGLVDAGRLRGTDPARESVAASTLRRVFFRLPAYCAPEELRWLGAQSLCPIQRLAASVGLFKLSLTLKTMLVDSEDVLGAKIVRSLGSDRYRKWRKYLSGPEVFRSNCWRERLCRNASVSENYFPACRTSSVLRTLQRPSKRPPASWCSNSRRRARPRSGLTLVCLNKNTRRNHDIEDIVPAKE